MLELFPEGFEERDSPDGIELAAYTDDSGEERLWSAFGGTRSTDVDEGWEERWRAFHRPVRIGPLWVGPPWEQPDEDAIPVVIDPGRAFGTGAHATTRLCLELLLDLPRGGLLDAGCGSGVLSIAGAKLGFDPVHAVDLDPQAIESTERNAAANGVTVETRLADAVRDPLPAADTAVVNVALDADRSIAARLSCRHIVTSGYLAAEAPELPGYRRGDRREAEGLGCRPARADGVRSAPMATFSVDFLGCKVSHADAQAVREHLLADGHEERPGGDVAVLNTCCVTHEALRKSRHAASRAARTHRRVFVTGCGANLAADAFAGLPENVTVIAKRSEETPGAVAGDVGAIACVQADARLDRIRAFVKVQDGCSFSCNFCVIPFVRGASRSRRADAVLAEIRRRVDQGHREVVLTGINLGCYRDRAAGYDLPRLIREAGATPGLARLRLSSIEVNHLTEQLVAALRETPTVSRHLHVPLQSGDDGVLRAMARRYDAGTYLRRVALAKGFNLTTDVIVGFPAEDDAAFERTVEVVQVSGATKVHVFPYSPRPGTVTAADDTVPKQVKRERSARLRALSHEACLRRWRAKVGTEDVVLVDRPGRGTETTTRRGSSTRRSGSSSASARAR